MLDEAQDTNPVTMDIFLNKFPKARLILVGDHHQQIYQFRGSIDAMKRIRTHYTLRLTETFRCNLQVVNIANYILEQWKEKKYLMQTNQNNKKKDNTAYITRTNAELISFISGFDDFSLTRDPNEIFASTFAVRDYLNGIKITHPTYSYLNRVPQKEFSELLETDHELKKAFQILSEFGKELDWLYKKSISNYRKYCYTKSKITAPVILSTAHACKGLEFDDVHVADDFVPLEEYLHEEELNIFDFLQEINLLYVAVTRAKRKTSISKDLYHLKNKNLLQAKISEFFSSKKKAS